MKAIVWTITTMVLVSATESASQSVPPTFNTDVAPILWNHCASCHRDGESAPFSLITFDEVRPRAQAIVRAVSLRRMPPWMPESNDGDFVGDRRLTPRDIDTLQRWAAGGFPRGSGDLPRQPEWTSGWQLGEPDAVIRMSEEFELPAGGSDTFRTFVIPNPIAGTRFVRAWEFRPDSPVVHHANIKIDRTRSSRILDEQEPAPGYEGGGSRKSAFPDGHFLGWTPGQSPRVLPDDMSWRVEPGSDFVVETHLVPSADAVRVRLRIGLYFSDRPPARVPYTLRLTRQDIDIAPGQKVIVSDSFSLPVNVDVLSVQPHAHHLAEEVRAFAVLPDGTAKSLILIRNWDFRWQDTYRYKTPLQLPRGTTLTLRYSYDNSADNPRNPNKPPRRVTFGQTSSSEMASLWVQVLTANARDRQILDGQFSTKLLRDDIEGYRKMIEVRPGDARAHAALGHACRESGDTESARVHFERALQLNPTYTSRYDLASVLLDARQWEEAAQHFVAALELKPDMAEAAFGLGTARHQQRRLAEAISAYRRALQLGLQYGAAHYNLARALFDTGTLEPAIEEYRRAIELDPEDADALADLAWVLATSERADIRDGTAAVRLAERAATLTNRQSAVVLDTLAVAYAASGEIDRAIETAIVARRIAEDAGRTDLAARIEQRLEFFRLQRKRSRP